MKQHSARGVIFWLIENGRLTDDPVFTSTDKFKLMSSVILKKEENGLKEALKELSAVYLANKKEIVVFSCVILVLVANKYLSNSQSIISFLDFLDMTSLKNSAVKLMTSSKNSGLYSLIYWTLVLDICYLLIPAVIIKFYLKEDVKNYGLNFHIEKGFLNYYVAMMAFMLILVYWASTTDSFQAKYPYYQITSKKQLFPEFIMWELFYLSQFYCLEFFYRGFMVKGLKPKFGLMSIFIMDIPYCMIHFGKPLPETLGSVFAGLILGYISYNGKSIIPGVLMHITVALAMDTTALYQKGLFSIA